MQPARSLALAFLVHGALVLAASASAQSMGDLPGGTSVSPAPAVDAGAPAPGVVPAVSWVGGDAASGVAAAVARWWTPWTAPLAMARNTVAAPRRFACTAPRGRP